MSTGATRMFFLETCVVLNALFHEPASMFHDWSTNFNHPYALLTIIDIGIKRTFLVPYFCNLPIELICILNKLEIYLIVDPKTNWLITKSTLTCFTKRAKCITLSVLETSLPMQRSHDTLVLDIFCLKLVSRGVDPARSPLTAVTLCCIFAINVDIPCAETFAWSQSYTLTFLTIKFFTVNTKLAMLSMLGSKVFTATKKLPPVGLDLIITSLMPSFLS